MNRDILSSCIIDCRGRRVVRINRDSALKLFDWSEDQEQIIKDYFKGPGRKVVRVAVKDGEDVDNYYLQSRVESAMAAIIIVPYYLNEIRDQYEGLFEYAVEKYGVGYTERVYRNIIYRSGDNLYLDPDKA